MSKCTERRRARLECVRCGKSVQTGYKYCSDCLDAENQRNKGRYRQRVADGLCAKCGIAGPLRTKLFCDSCASLQIARSRASQNKIKAKVFDHYGHTCKCCGETMKECLTIDHINGGGNLHRKMIRGGGPGFYRWLVVNGFPDGFQTLCMNCQFGRKHNNGVCPHKVGAQQDVCPSWSCCAPVVPRNLEEDTSYVGVRQ